MPKKKRTRKQKIQTDQRQVDHEVIVRDKQSQPTNPTSTKQQNAVPGISFSLPTSYANKKVSAPLTQPTTVAISTNEYTYLGKDLLKTGVLTSVIVIVECLIRFVYPMS